MEEERKRKKEKKTPQIKTFPVTAELEEIQENTNTPIILSKEQIINKALDFHSKGNIKEAQKSYQDIINQGIKDHRIFSNYGVILNNIGNTKEAQILYRKAIKLKPDFSDAHLNLGNILKTLGQPEEAEISTRRAIELRPDFAMAHYNLGSILLDLGKLKEAEISTRRAIELRPDFSDSYMIMAKILIANKNKKESIKFMKKYLHLKVKKIDTESNIKNVIDLFSEKITSQGHIPTFFDNAIKNHIINENSDHTDYSYLFESYINSKNNRFIPYKKRKVITQNKRQINGLPFLLSQGTHSLIKWKEYDLYKTTNDLVLYSMILNEIQPEIIIELGSGNGGSAVWMADIARSIGFETHIFSYDINKPNFNYKDITFVEFDIRKLNSNQDLPCLPSCKGRRKLIIEDAHVNILNVLITINKFIEKEDYLIIEDSSAKQRQIEDFIQIEPEKFMLDQYYLDFFGINMTCSIDSIFKIF